MFQASRMASILKMAANRLKMTVLRLKEAAVEWF